MKLTLTFDNGPTPGVTEPVLDALGERDLLATFFVVGRDLLEPGRRELAQEAASRGHWHGNHTMTHSVQLGDATGPDLPHFEIEHSQRVLGQLSHPDKFFRPWGNGQISTRILSRDAVALLTERAYTCVLWNCVPRDWEDADGWPETALSAIAVEDWTVLVLHDQDTGAMRHLPRFLDEAAALGVEFRQDFPDQCVPIRSGVPTASLDHLMPA